VPTSIKVIEHLERPMSGAETSPRTSGFLHKPMPNAHSKKPSIPPAWLDAAKQTIREDVCRIIVLGAVDVGKSTFCGELLRPAHQAGRTARFVDSDVGQKMVGAPACVTLSQATSDAELSLIGLVLVGTTNPVRAGDSGAGMATTHTRSSTPGGTGRGIVSSITIDSS
jgi:polynucleotide 5'-kinase involved in rRNA processing